MKTGCTGTPDILANMKGRTEPSQTPFWDRVASGKTMNL